MPARLRPAAVQRRHRSQDARHPRFTEAGSTPGTCHAFAREAVLNLLGQQPPRDLRILGLDGSDHSCGAVFGCFMTHSASIHP
jgi:hypothetical protein